MTYRDLRVLTQDKIDAVKGGNFWLGVVAGIAANAIYDNLKHQAIVTTLAVISVAAAITKSRKRPASTPNAFALMRQRSKTSGTSPTSTSGAAAQTSPLRMAASQQPEHDRREPVIEIGQDFQERDGCVRERSHQCARHGAGALPSPARSRNVMG